MSIEKRDKMENFEETISPKDGQGWNKQQRDLVEKHTQLIHDKRTPERILRNKMLSILYRMEEYLQKEDVKNDELYTIEFFVREFLNVLGMNKAQFANHLDIDPSNLNKYYRGQRGFNAELAMKFGSFFHTPVDVWLRIQLKNELILLMREKETSEKYSKYDYEKLQIA